MPGQTSREVERASLDLSLSLSLSLSFTISSPSRQSRVTRRPASSRSREGKQQRNRSAESQLGYSRVLSVTTPESLAYAPKRRLVSPYTIPRQYHSIIALWAIPEGFPDFVLFRITQRREHSPLRSIGGRRSQSFQHGEYACNHAENLFPRGEQWALDSRLLLLLRPERVFREQSQLFKVVSPHSFVHAAKLFYTLRALHMILYGCSFLTDRKERERERDECVYLRNLVAILRQLTWFVHYNTQDFLPSRRSDFESSSFLLYMYIYRYICT